jgi:predicted nucleic acid-binding protein
LDDAVALAVSRVSRDAVPDMPDRIIAATAVHLDLPLVSRDGYIRVAGIEVIW